MSTEVLAIVGLTLIGLALPVMGAWAYQTFALKRELDDATRRIEQRICEIDARNSERANRIETNLDLALKSFEHSIRDICLLLGKLEERYPRNHP